MQQSTKCGYGLIKMRMKKRILFQEEAKTDEKRIMCKFTFSFEYYLKTVLMRFVFKIISMGVYETLSSTHICR